MEVWVLIVAVAVAFTFGGYRALTDGRFRGTRRISASQLSVVEHPGAASPVVEQRGPAEGLSVSKPREPGDNPGADVRAAIPGATFGERATLLQFSSAFCAPCRATRRTLGEVAELVPGVEHLELDAEHHLELVRRLRILRTPTTLVLDATGREVTRATGAPRKEQVLAALGQT